MNYPLYEIVSEENRYIIRRMAQISNVWKLTDTYMEIELDGITNIIDDYTGEIIYTVKDLYNSFNYIKPNPRTHPSNISIFNFKFQDGKCIEVYKLLTGI